MVLECRACGKTKKVNKGQVVNGVPVLVWFVRRGHLCSTCHAAAPPNIGPDFAGDAYVRALDHRRLTGQLLRVHDVMKDGEWRTVHEIEMLTGDPGPSILAQLGHLRKARFGAFLVQKQSRGRREDGLWEYRVGGKGEGVPRRNPVAVRAEEAEARAAVLEAALSRLCPSHPLLVAS
jgi:hypothetical protein